MILGHNQQEIFFLSGYLVLKKFFTLDEIEIMKREAERLLLFLVNSSIANKRTSGRLDIRSLPNKFPIVRKIQPIVDLSPLFSSISYDNRILRVVEQLQKKSTVLMEEKLSYKQKLFDKISEIDTHEADDRFLAHNDYAYHRLQNYPPTIISCGIVMDPCTSTTGPLRVWPGTHRGDLAHETVYKHQYRSFQVPSHVLTSIPAVDLITEPGTAIFFHDLLVHSSPPNLSGHPRRILFFSYCPKDGAPDPDVRNRPTRQVEAPYEQRYLDLKALGQYQDQFFTF